MAKRKPKATELAPAEVIEQRIFLIRGKSVMLDSHLAELYGVRTAALNQAVQRNLLSNAASNKRAGTMQEAVVEG